MGLDNGIMARPTPELAAQYPNIFRQGCRDEDGWYEVAYWRKCYNVRGAILGIIEDFQIASDSPLTASNVGVIAEMLDDYPLEDWEEQYDKGLTIWSWEDIEVELDAQAKRLKLLAQLMRKNEEIEVTFYDSY